LRKKEIAAGEFTGPTQDPRETTWSEVGAALNMQLCRTSSVVPAPIPLASDPAAASELRRQMTA
jgi:hypothetical protein